MPDTHTTQPALIVFREKDDKSFEAGWFTEAEAGRAKAERSKLGLTTMENLSERVRDFAVNLPTGCFESDGKLLLGRADRATIDQLLALRAEERKAGATEGQGGVGQSKAAQPVAEKTTDPKASPRGERAATGPSAAGSKGSGNEHENVRPSPTIAELIDQLWSKIAVGSVVIAPEDDRTENGWWEAVVIEKRGQTLTVRWRDFPKQRPATRKLTEVALAHPKSGV